VKLFLKKSLWPYTWAMVRTCKASVLSRIRYAIEGFELITIS